MSEIVQWLARLGLDKYANVFIDAEVDQDTLPHLSDADLRELGLPMGPRRKILAAIASDPQRISEASSAVACRRPSAGRTEAERRQLTVMFVDLVDSTALSSRLDPEEMGDLLREYQNAVTGEISRLGGHVAKLIGDGVLAYFGRPIAHENAAERAVRAGLAISPAVARLDCRGNRQLAARTGIATRLVVVGELIGREEAQERTVVGETPNLAARLQSVAAPGEVVIAQGIQRLLGRLFDTQELPHSL